MHCPVTRKTSYDSKVLAEEALFSHQARQFHAPGHGPINVYECEHCGAWHFTSKGAPHPDLEKAQAKGTLDREREANFWERKLR